MTRIGLLSDTHGYLDGRILEYLKECDEIWHAGDFGTIAVAEQLRKIAPVRGVYGNIDGQDVRVQFPKKLRFYCEQLDVLMTHIGGYPGRYSLDIREEIYRNPPGLFITGHSHILKVMPDKARLPLLHINPGAAGRHGFHKVRTLVRFTVDGKKIQDLQAIELGPRTLPAEV